jgi:hypothetical protein
MRKFRKLFQITAIAGVLFMANACAEDETFDELNQTIEKYQIEDSSTGENDDKPPSGN